MTLRTVRTNDRLRQIRLPERRAAEGFRAGPRPQPEILFRPLPVAGTGYAQQRETMAMGNHRLPVVRSWPIHAGTSPDLLQRTLPEKGVLLEPYQETTEGVVGMKGNLTNTICTVDMVLHMPTAATC